MSFYATPLQFGYFFGLLLACIFWIRAYREDRLSDFLLGMVMFFFSMEIQDYTLGFSGINILWEELDAFPRHFPWVFPASIYFYVLAQTNTNFKFEKKHLKHLLPYVLYFLVSIILFSMGKEKRCKYTCGINGQILTYIELIFFTWLPIFIYSFLSLKHLRAYKIWLEDQYSDTYKIGFNWLKDFLMLFIISMIFRFIFMLLDFSLNLPYEKDYFWQLFVVFLIIYFGLRAFSQFQPNKLKFTAYEKTVTEKVAKDSPQNFIENDQLEILAEKLKKDFETNKTYLNSELTLSDLAAHLKTNTSLLSACINKNFNKNFNDFVNENRINEFKIEIKKPENANYTLFAVANDCGFNSKATFNRAIKKAYGITPKELINLK